MFTIGETGFGTGLNFLAVWDLWRRTAPGRARLHFLSAEKYPLAREDLERAHRPFTELGALGRRLRGLYPPLYAGFHRLHFDEDRVTLTLLFGEAGDMLEALEARVDAWFLDGFSPSSNPDLWRPEVLNRIGALTSSGGTAASFTVAGAVRSGLEAAGFEVEKAPGFGRKRHMLRARRRAAKAIPILNADRPPSALVVGAGLAGSSAAHALARRGVAVTLIDPDPQLHRAASGNPAGVACPRPAADSSPAGRFHCAAFDYAERHAFRVFPEIFDPCGVLELAPDDRSQARFRALAGGRVLPGEALQALTVEEASQAAGIALPLPALHYPQGGLVRPARCAASMRGTAELRSARVLQLAPADRGWTARLDDGEEASADIAVLACGMDARTLGAPVPVTASRGQLSLAPVTAESAALKKVLSFGAYVSPPADGYHILGATYDNAAWPPDEAAQAERTGDHERNYAALRAVLPQFPLAEPGPGLRGRVAFRCTTPDRLPLCGPVPGLPPEFENIGTRINSELNEPYHSAYRTGLFVFTGLGSRGLSTAPWLGEYLASLACGEPLPAERVVTQLLHPSRFFIRALRRAGIRALPGRGEMQEDWTPPHAGDLLSRPGS